MKSQIKLEKFLSSKTNRIEKGEYLAAIKNKWLSYNEKINAKASYIDQLEAERGKINQVVVDAFGVEKNQLKKLLNLPDFIREPKKDKDTKKVGPLFYPPYEIVKASLEQLRSEPQFTTKRIWLPLTPEETLAQGYAVPQWLGPPNAFRLRDEVFGKSTGGGIHTYHRKTNIKNGALVFTMTHILEKFSRIDSAGVYFAKVYPDAALGVSEGNWYESEGQDVNIFYPPSVGEVEQGLNFEVLINPPNGGTSTFYSEMGQPGLYVDDKEVGGDLYLPKSNMPPDFDLPINEWFPAGSQIDTYLQLTYYLYTFGRLAYATIIHNLYAFPYLVVTTVD